MLKYSFKAAAVCLGAVLCASSAVYADDGGFTIENYNVDVNVDTARNYKISEDIYVDFTQPRHGITRTIPMGDSGDYYEINNVEVIGDKADVSRSSLNTELKIGDAEKTIVGLHEYKINYELAHGRDNADGYDHVYLNLIGTEWNCTINNAQITVNLPSEDIQYVNVTTGEYGSTAAADYVIDGTAVHINVSKLKPYEGITAEIRVPERTFADAPVYFAKAGLIGIGALIIGFMVLISALIIFLIKGKDKKLISNIQYYPPDSMTPLEIGYLYDNTVDPRDISSMIIYWASKGYLQFERTGKKDFVLKKLKDIKGKSYAYETKLFNGLWKCGGGESVTNKQLEASYYRYKDGVPEGLEVEFMGEKELYDTSTKPLKWIVQVIGYVVSIILIAAVSIYEKNDIIESGMILGVYAIITAVLEYIIIKAANKIRISRIATIIKIALVLFLHFIVSITAMFVLFDFVNYFNMTVALEFLWFTIIAGYYTDKRSEYGHRILEDIQGFKDFLKTAEKDKLEMLIDETPEYFYNILPYANVLGVSDKWANKFKNIITDPPRWYYDSYGHDPFSTAMFTNSLFRSMDASSASSAPSSSGSSSSSSFDGGFSGGGSGGGGGGSW